jgi:cytochrome c5
VSKQDSQFFNVFSMVLGILVAVALILMALARSVGANTQVQQVRSDPTYVAEVGERVQPFVRVAVAGQDNSALVIAPPTGSADAGAGAAAELPTDGKGLYEAACTACHTAGIGGAPKSGDKGAWAPRIAQGKDILYKHAIEGYQGKGGVMPAKGGRTDAPDDLVKLAVDYMVELKQ